MKWLWACISYIPFCRKRYSSPFKNTFNYGNEGKVTTITNISTSPPSSHAFASPRNVQRIASLARWRRERNANSDTIEFECGESGCSTRFHRCFFFFFFFFFLHARSTHRGGDKWRWIRQRSAINDGRRTMHGPERGGRRTSLAVAETRPVVCTPNTRAWRICIALYKQCF